MATITGGLVGEAGAVIDTSHNDVNSWNAGSNYTSLPTSFQITQFYRNNGNVTQRVTVTTSNLSANLTDVTIDLGNGTNVMELAPGAKTSWPVVTINGTLPAQPGAGQPAVTESFSFDLDPVWEVIM